MASSRNNDWRRRGARADESHPCLSFEIASERERARNRSPKPVNLATGKRERERVGDDGGDDTTAGA